MTDYDEQFLKRWEKKREAGMPKYLFSTGGIFALAAVFAFIVIELYNNSLKEVFSSGEAVERVITYFALGLAFGGVMWYLNNRKYEKLK
ncbi:MAG TPA: hypothetical protein VF181_07195 [Balneolaceae bacterium]